MYAEWSLSVLSVIRSSDLSSSNLVSKHNQSSIWFVGPSKI